jgi:hypothetical protein
VNTKSSSAAAIAKAERARLAIRLMVSLQYLKNAFNLSDEELVQRWSENVEPNQRTGLGGSAQARHGHAVRALAAMAQLKN